MTLRLLQNKIANRKIKLVWTPAHASMEGNEFAHQQACALAPQATEEGVEYCPLITFREVTQHYRLERQTLPPPHPSLSKEQQTVFRLIQSGSFPHPTRLHLMFPEQYSAECKFCKKPGSLRHIIGECDFSSENPPLLHPPTPSFREQWEILMSSSSLATQLALVDRAQAAMTSYGLQ